MRKMRPTYAQRLYAIVQEIIFLLMIVFIVRTFLFGLYQVPSGSMETTMLVGERFFGDKLSYWFRKPAVGEVVAFSMPTYSYSTFTPMRLLQEYIWGPENWTKRVIGVPGDHIKGMLEEGKTVIYRNGKKLDEPYVNQYPLVYIVPENKELIREQIIAELSQIIPIEQYPSEVIDRIAQHMMKEYARPKSYDPQSALAKQPFYRMCASELLQDEHGNVLYESPGTPIINDSDDHLENHADEFDVQLGSNEYWLMGDNRLGSTDSRWWGPVSGRLIHGRIVFRIWSIDSSMSWWILDLVRNPIDFWSRIRWSRCFQIIA